MPGKRLRLDDNVATLPTYYRHHENGLRGATAIDKGRGIVIRRGFQSHAYIMQEVDSAASGDLLRHSRGVAVEFTWDGCTEDEMMNVGLALFDGIEEPVKIVLDTEKNSVYVSRGANQSILIEKTINNSRVVRKAA